MACSPTSASVSSSAWDESIHCSSNNDESLTENEKPRSSSSLSQGPGKMRKPCVVHSKACFDQEWTKKYPCIVAAGKDSAKALCSVCSNNFSVCHQRVRDIEHHISGLTHQSESHEVDAHTKITTSFLPQSTSLH